MDRSCQSGIVGVDLVSSWGIQMSILLSLLLFNHLKTGFVSPQYHVVFDDLFKTVFSSGADDALVDSICENLYGTSCKIYATNEYDAHNNLVYKPHPLDKVWLQKDLSRVRLSYGSNANVTKI